MTDPFMNALFSATQSDLRTRGRMIAEMQEAQTQMTKGVVDGWVEFWFPGIKIARQMRR